ncbi:MAG: flagellar filament capping protein FliD [Solirubrobacteraceae bacterium]|nr:flagellar filament capping protein FliD [Solirubrobacteraceae bacterium]
MNLALGGLASGLDTASLIDQIMQLERRPRVRLAMSETVEQARQDSLRQVTTRLRSLLAATKDLASTATWADTQAVDVSDTTKLAVRRTGAAAIGGYVVEVSALARAEQRSYDFTAAAGTLDVGGEQFTFSATDDGNAVAAAINARATSAFNAVFLDGSAGGTADRLVLTRKQTGVYAPGAATVGGPQLGPETFKSGADAAFTIDGVAATSATNVVSTALPGVELTLKGLGAATVNVSAPAPDPEAVKGKLKAFVDQYNQTIDLIRGATSEKRVPAATTTADAKKGVLFADTQLTGLLSSLRGIVADVSGLGGSIQRLSDLGISTGAATGGAATADSLAGKLVIDDAKLSSALADHRGDVRAFLSDATAGLAARVTSVLDPLVRTDGAMDARTGEVGRRIADIGKSLERMDARLELRQSRLQQTYAAMETALAQVQQQGSWLSGQLASLNR